MKDLSIVQKYMVCTVNDKGVFPFASVEERTLGLVAGALLELQMEGCIAVDGKKVSAAGALPQDKGYLKPLYDFIREKQSVKLYVVVDAYNFSWTDKRINELRDAVGGSLVQLGAASACKAGLLGKQAGYLPGPETVRSVVEQMRAELLEEGPVSDETAALVALLERVKCLKAYFSAFEQKAVRQKIEALTQSPEGKMVRDMMTYLQIIMYSFAARGAAAAGS
ncbi:MAG TPA: GPP34 family phosphoprotein [Candidatus Faecalibacterium avium]|nr:GPP34 family phosphoprotein [Candidatus Faecalibacterium avium]